MTADPAPPRTGHGRLPAMSWAWLLLAGFAAVTAAVALRLTLDVDERTLPWFTWLDEYPLGHAIPRVLVLGGQFWLTGTLAVLAGAWASWRLHRWAPVIVSAVTVLGLDVVLWVVKVWIGRPAPASGINDVFVPPGVSYPGGHAACALVACLWIVHMIAVVDPNTSWLRAAHVGAVVLAVVVALTTHTLGYHWITDTLGGWLLAGAIVIGARHALGRWWGASPPVA